MAVITPKYDNDTITYGYLKQYLDGAENTKKEGSGESTIAKSYSTPPNPPYYKDSLMIIDKKIYKCTKDRLVGTFSWDDWKLITDGEELSDFIESTYSPNMIQISEQIDSKIESYYQATSPATDWTTDLEKAKHVGDYWYDTTTKNQYRYSKNTTTTPITYEWKQVDVPSAIYDMIDTKKSIYTSKPTNYKQNDMWIIEDTISEEDLPEGVNKGDWVFAKQDSTSYDKSHWEKRDNDITIEYLEDHYYTTEEINQKFELVDSTIDSKITQSKEDIMLSVESNYTTKESVDIITKDYDEVISELTKTITTNTNNITSLSVEKDRIVNRITSISSNIDENGNITEVKTSTGFTFNADGLNIAKDGKSTKSKIDEDGIQILSTKTNEVVTEFTSKGMTTDDFNAKNGIIAKVMFKDIGNQTFITRVGD